jgi:signal transduction histidine kinase
MGSERGHDDPTEALFEAAVALASEVELDPLLRRIVEAAVAVTGATYGALGVLDPDGAIREFITVGVTDEERGRIGDPPIGRGLLGAIVTEGHVLNVPRIADDPRSVGFPPNHPRMTALLGAPIVAHGLVFGRLYLTDPRGRDRFDRADERAITLLAAQAGVAIQNARLVEELRRAQEEVARLEVFEERERIAKELHDGVIQSLFAVGMGLQGIGALATEPEVARRIEDAVDQIDEAIRDLRSYIFGLRPGVLADRQLDDAIARLCEELTERTGVLAVAEVDPRAGSELASVAADVVQIVREALSNVGRHAEATTCRVSLRMDDGAADLVIDDDGLGFDPSTPSEGLGLENLKKRVEQLGGELSIESGSGSGTTVRARLPR